MIDMINDLKALADERVKAFSAKLTPTNYEILGVTVPNLRTYAKCLATKHELSEFHNFQPKTYEELTVYGFVIAMKKMPIADKFPYILHFTTLNDNWASNDTVASTFKNHSEEYFQFLTTLINQSAWQTRFAVIAMLADFLDDNHIDRILQLLSTINYGDYYVDMGVAWLLSVALVKLYEPTFDYLNQVKLTEFVLRKTVSKCCDSKRISASTKQNLREWLKLKLSTN